MPPSNILHLPARPVLRPGATRPAFPSRAAGRTPSCETDAHRGDYHFLCSDDGFLTFPTRVGEASDDVVARIIHDSRGAARECEERRREDPGRNVMILSLIIVGIAVVAIGLAAVFVLYPTLLQLFGRGL